MVGLSVILENYRDLSEKRGPQILSKGAMFKPSSPSGSTTPPPPPPPKLSSASGFLEFCFLCKHKLMPAKDIYMYKGDKAFCSEECRYRQIFMDEEESGCTVEYTCSLAATSSPSSSSSSSSPSSASRKAGGRARARANAFAY